ncbi:Non-canonical poly(A) RNA polymerase protein Trf4-1 [Chionoecetes opilio]|uniref:Non-canonical poly(A) RNA polymerase protein Trf4-1 n=1 Tax=Chionoecetes opilio TaxID=41210 RepID=A0A8J4XT17_CHIOP|nr:Non-canonical poly(A) RNA polymerase protein Trf4-1 [Chionoecetes opilio]
MRQYKSLTPLALLVKYYLRRLGLADVFTGGCPCKPPPSWPPASCSCRCLRKTWKTWAGLIVVRFLYFYGYEFLYTPRGISVLEGRCFLRKDDVPTVMPGGHGRSPLCIQDPLTPGNDVGRSSFGIWNVQKALRHVFLVLEPA